MASGLTGKGILLLADPIAKGFRDEVQQMLAQAPKPPKLVGILSTSSIPSKNYAEFTKKQCESLGVRYELKTTGKAASVDLDEGEGVEEAIIEANEDDDVDGIMVGRPTIVHRKPNCP
jgi:methylenetetrahydrofolate dehydrogenase (NAD+)